MIASFGMDYGVKPRMILVSDQSFIEYFDKAKCIGMIYVNCKDDLGNTIPTEIGFNFEDAEQGTKFIEELIRWIEESEGDENAVDMEFVELNNGEYMVAFAQNRDLLCERMVPAILRERIAPIVFMFYKGKELTTGNNYAEFKKNYVQGTRIIVRGFVGIGTGKEEKILSSYFIKSSFRFVKEDDLEFGSVGYSILKAKNSRLTRKNMKRTEPVNFEPITKRRETELAYFFPVTIDRIKRNGWLSELIVGMPPHLERHHVEQAICNLILSERLKQQNSTLPTTGPGHDMNILRYLIESIESFDSYFPPDEFFTKALVKQQLKRDKDFLTTYLSKK